jgi:acetyltransferase-like isoleucine patch superfamily enzyme
MRFLKELVKILLYRPWGVTFGERSFIRRPYTIAGRKHVLIGARTSIGRDLHLLAVTEYAGLTYSPRVIVGNDVYIGRHAYITAIDSITIGDGCVLSEYVYVTDEVHGIDPRAGLIIKQKLVSKGPVVIGPNCFLGFCAAVMPGVTLGAHCVVGSNSTVTRSFPAYSMIGGSPARLLKRYSQSLGRWVLPSEVEE